MKSFNQCTGVLIPLPQANLDTDRIIPKQYLKTVQRTGLGAYLFDEMRFHDTGFPGKPAAERQPRADFVLNQPPFNQVNQHTPGILITGENFGCGSSREHAVWSLMDFGIQVVIAPSFADIFFTNCSKNGLLTVVLPAEQVDELTRAAAANPGTAATVNLPRQSITLDGAAHGDAADTGRNLNGGANSDANGKGNNTSGTNGEQQLSYTFDIDPMRKRIFSEGLDDIAVTLQSAARIKEFEQAAHRQRPWLQQGIS